MSIKKQLSKRYNTEIRLMIEGLTNPYKHESRMNNLSRSGARCSFKNDAPVKVGDVVQFQVYLEEVRKRHSVSARVVWVEPVEGDLKEAGYEFISSEEMYRSVLNAI